MLTTQLLKVMEMKEKEMLNKSKSKEAITIMIMMARRIWVQSVIWTCSMSACKMKMEDLAIAGKAICKANFHKEREVPKGSDSWCRLELEDRVSPKMDAMITWRIMEDTASQTWTITKMITSSSIQTRCANAWMEMNTFPKKRKWMIELLTNKHAQRALQNRKMDLR